MTGANIETSDPGRTLARSTGPALRSPTDSGRDGAGAVHENALVSSLAAVFTRSPRQLNRLQESDAELVALDGTRVLALSTDAVAEEIASGLYADPWLAGWMSVMVNFSDLAAVGAQPLGILIAETLPPDLPTAALRSIQKGIQDACEACGSHVLGGDTNRGDALHIAGTAVGLIAEGRPLTRLGIQPDDLIFSTGPLGGGNAFAAAILAGLQETGAAYRPVARLPHGQAIRPHAGACMDTSDGGLATLDQLGRLNGIGFSLVPKWASHLDPLAAAAAERLGFPPWVFLAGPHGEFELIFSVPAGRARAVQDALRPLPGACTLLARATPRPGIDIPGLGLLAPGDLADLRNLEIPTKEGFSHYLRAILTIGAAAQNRTPN